MARGWGPHRSRWPGQSVWNKGFWNQSSVWENKNAQSLYLIAATKNALKHSQPQMLRFLLPCVFLHTHQSLSVVTNTRMGVSHPALIKSKLTICLKTVVWTRYSVFFKKVSGWGNVTHKIMITWLLLKVFHCVWCFLKQKYNRQNSLFMLFHIHIDMTA